MNPEDLVLDAIDELVNESLSTDEPRGARIEKCRCGTDWHGIPTSRCPGSASEGPLRPTLEERQNALAAQIDWLEFRLEFGEAFRRVGEELSAKFAAMTESLNRGIGLMQQHQISAFHNPEPPADTPQQRALPRPSTSPPMWAQDATRSRRRR